MEHVSVLLKETISALAPVARRVVVDCTVGAGGHAQALLESMPSGAVLVGLDMDGEAVTQAGERLAGFGPRVRLVRANFSQVAGLLAGMGYDQVDALLADLGFSSSQLADPRRGLSFERDGPLDMRLDATSGPTAADLLNNLPEAELADLLYMESQERGSRIIARRIGERRRRAPLASTLELARLVADAVGRRSAGRRIHPATRTFLALRRAVNRETEALAALLRQAPGLLRPGGRIAVISFQSMEDRQVKEEFRRQARAGVYRVLTARPIRAAEAERRENPRSRSARLRVAERVDGGLAGAVPRR